MVRLVPAIHAFYVESAAQDVDARHKDAHDGSARRRLQIQAPAAMPAAWLSFGYRPDPDHLSADLPAMPRKPYRASAISD